MCEAGHILNLRERDLLELQVRTLYRVDRLGRLVCVNDLGEPAPPRVFIGTGSDGSRVVRVGAGMGEREWRALLRCASDPEAVRATLEAKAPVEREQRGPAYVLPAHLRAGPRAIPVTDPAILHPELAPWGPELAARRPCFGVVEAGQVVSICCCARTTGEAAEAGVETASAFRSRGMAAEAVAAWAEAVIASGRVAFYSTSRENLASRAVARKLGAFEFGEDWSLE